MCSPHPNKESRKRRRAISIKGGKYRTGSRTPVGFTVLDATPVSAPTNDYTNDHTNHNGQFDFMDQNAELGAASAALAARSSRTPRGPKMMIEGASAGRASDQ